MEHQHYFSWNIDASLALHGEYNLLLVYFSYLVASIAGFCALSILGFARHNESKRALLTIVGGITLGLGIWGMHFVGMLALTLPVKVYYDLTTTFASIVPAVAGSFVFLYLLSKEKPNVPTILFIGLVLASSIAAMHFIGMSAMSMPAHMTHDPVKYGFAIAVSWVLAVVTILVQQKRVGFLNQLHKVHIVTSGLLFGFSVANMHYLAMNATFFFPFPGAETSGISNDALSLFAVGFIVVLMATMIIVLFIQNKIGGLKQTATEHQQRVIDTVDNMQDGFVLCDDSGEILLVNQRFSDIFMTPFDPLVTVGDKIESLYKNLVDTFFVFATPIDKADFIALVNDKSEKSLQTKVQCKDDTWWLYRKNRTAANMIIQTWSDITEQVTKEAELLEVRKMASMGGLVAGVAHELNTPLGVGITALSSIKDILEDIQLSVREGKVRKTQLDESLSTIEELEKLAESNMNVMAKIIQQFKFLSVDQTVEKASLFSMNSAVEDIRNARKEELQNQGITFCLDIQENITLFSFQKGFIEVINSLINNAIEHAFDGQPEPSISLVASIRENSVVMTFSDNGMGIDASIAHQIFEPFVTTKRRNGQVGLGLHIAYNLITQKLKGKIKLLDTSTSSKTAFQIDIPIDISH